MLSSHTFTAFQNVQGLKNSSDFFLIEMLLFGKVDNLGIYAVFLFVFIKTLLILDSPCGF